MRAFEVEAEVWPLNLGLFFPGPVSSKDSGPYGHAGVEVGCDAHWPFSEPVWFQDWRLVACGDWENNAEVAGGVDGVSWLAVVAGGWLQAWAIQPVPQMQVLR